ncbi:MAG: DUF2203 domain-containing protein [Bdellovibrio sp. CG10_big_fil_rev_8_21_14_0_10_47_8]|nr:MAG: DUF2203 domain-containing protein [Bdellovibrio sp. CG10_big_fil_rev_8_21_14_0_10_47_8]
MEIVSLNKKRTFTVDSAQELLPVIYKITEEAHKDVKVLTNQMNAVRGTCQVKAGQIEEKINDIVDRWHQKIAMLGGCPKGIWLADFDSGQGYYCWKFPETRISFWHGYNDGFSGRIPLQPSHHGH